MGYQLVFWLLFSLCSIAQTTQKKGNIKQKEQAKETDAFTKELYENKTENTEAHYPSGSTELYKIIGQKLVYSDADVQNRTKGNAIMSFNVLADSTLSDIKIVKAPCIDCSKDLIQIFQNLKFAPATYNGVPSKSNIVMEVPLLAQ